MGGPMAWGETIQAKCQGPDDHRQNGLNDEEWSLVAPLVLT